MRSVAKSVQMLVRWHTLALASTQRCHQASQFRRRRVALLLSAYRSAVRTASAFAASRSPYFRRRRVALLLAAYCTAVFYIVRAAHEAFEGDEEMQEAVLETLSNVGAPKDPVTTARTACFHPLASNRMANGWKRVEDLCAGDAVAPAEAGARAPRVLCVVKTDCLDGKEQMVAPHGGKMLIRGGTEPPPDTHADQAPAAGVGGGQTAALPRASSAQSWKILCWKGQIFVRLNQAALTKTVTQADGSRVRTGVTKTLEVSSADTVLSVKKQLQQLQLQGAAGRLLFAGKELSDDATLAEYGVSRGSTLDALPRCRGAGGVAAPVAAASAQNQQHAPPSRVELQLGHSGLGLFIAKEGPGPFVITRLIPGGAAALSGQMGVGDLMHAIGTTSLYELGEQQAKALIRGTPGPGVTLWIARAQAHLDSTPRNIGPAAQGEQTSLHIEEKRVLVEQVAALQQQVAALQGRRLAEGSAEASSDTVAQEEVRRERRSTRANAGGGKTARV